MKTVTVMYMKGSDFTHLFISIDGEKFSEDKTDFIAGLPIRSWFKPSDDDFFEWVGFVEEIERAANTGIENLSFEFRGDKNDETIFMEELSNSGVRHDFGVVKASPEDKSKEEQADRWEHILEQAYDDLDKGNDTAAFRGFQKAFEKSTKAKFEMAQLYLFGKGVKEDKVRAVELLLECEKEGLLEANSSLAQCYYCGWGVEENEDQAYEYAVKGYNAPEKYGFMAHYFAGCCLLFGEEIEENLDEAIRHLKVAVDAEYGGYFALGLAYEEKEDYASAFKIYEAGAKVDPDCFYYLAKCYEEGKGVPQDDYKAFENMKKVPETNYDGQMLLAIYYIQGIGTTQDIEKAEEMGLAFLKEHSEDPDLQALLAMCHWLKAEFEEAAEYFKKAIEMGDDTWKTKLGDCYLRLGKYKMAEDILISALNDSPDDGEIFNYLGECYFDNDSPLKDNKKAIKYYEKGASLGSADSMYSLATYYLDINNFDKAAEYYEMAAQNGHLGAKAIMGAAEYDNGNISEAVKLLEEPAQDGNPYAQYYLGKCYLNDEYTGQDNNQGIYWLSKAAEGGNGQACLYLSYIYGKEEFKDDQKSYEYELKGAELDDVDCKYYLAIRYIYEEKYYDEERGIGILRKLSKDGMNRAKYTLAEYYYDLYRKAIRKIGLFDTEDESVVETLSKCIPIYGINLVTTPLIWTKKKIKQKGGEKDLTNDDIVRIREMIKLYEQIKSNSNGLRDDQVKQAIKHLKSIKDKYRR